MIDKNMIALAEIRYGYNLPKYGNLTLEQNSLIKYDNLCLKLIEENQKYKEIIDKINLKIADYLENNYSIYAENEIEIDLINEIDNLLKEALNET